MMNDDKHNRVRPKLLFTSKPKYNKIVEPFTCVQIFEWS